MRTCRLILTFLISVAAVDAAAGSKNLLVAFFDYTENGIGKASFKSIRTSHYQHPCWQKFVEIEDIETAYIENPPRSLSRQLLLSAIHGSPTAARQFAQVLRSERLFGAYAFVPDASGKYATIYGINYQDGAISSSSSLVQPMSGTIPNATFSKALCEASASMD